MAITPAAITPELNAVGGRIRNRTLDSLGRELGTFTGDTRPTDAEARTCIDTAARYVARELGKPGTTWDGDLLEDAKDAVASRAALLIETSYYADGSRPDNDIADQLGRIAREELDSLKTTARDNQIGGERIRSIRIVSANRRTSGA
ncbi:hypothetical protein PAI11_37510 [Patulibacter medicamentivorans]|uniref:Uncharacterized protein n=1 Tax=Patulibacter medicamentivorans TaxID=1097667 RepID=H0EA77_9ACTN|nr:hypothetical protein [Patulibacter medicamentivorans]EHN09417.1 hypothetical protein PAI11_37510 [Patulibacter medicamentivorans]